MMDFTKGNKPKKIEKEIKKVETPKPVDVPVQVSAADVEKMKRWQRQNTE